MLYNITYLSLSCAFRGKGSCSIYYQALVICAWSTIAASSSDKTIIWKVEVRCQIADHLRLTTNVFNLLLLLDPTMAFDSIDLSLRKMVPKETPLPFTSFIIAMQDYVWRGVFLLIMVNGIYILSQSIANLIIAVCSTFIFFVFCFLYFYIGLSMSYV